MSRFFLTRLSIEGFRGINNDAQPLVLSFEAGSVNSVYAHNGGGKSSVFEAIEYLITGRVTKLSGLPAAERAEGYFANRFHSTRHAKIAAEFTSDDGAPSVGILVERDAHGVRQVSSPTGYSDPVGFLRSLNHELLLLDYAKFGRFIEETPLNRGRSFASLLGLGKLSELRQTFEALSETRSLQNDLSLNVLEAEETQIVTEGRSVRARLNVAVEGLLGAPVEEPINAESVAQSAATALQGIPLLAPLVQGKPLASVEFETLEKTVSEAEGGKARSELSTLVAQIAGLSAVGSPDLAAEKSEVDGLRKHVANREKALEGTRGPRYQSLLDAAAVFLQADNHAPATRCPLCGSDCDRSVEHIVREHLTAYTAVHEAEREIKVAERSAAWWRRLGNLETSPILAVPEEERVQSLVQPMFSAGQLSSADLEKAVSALSRLETARDAKSQDLTVRKGEVEKTLPPSLVALTQQLAHARAVRDTLRERSALLKRLERVRKRKAAREKWKRFVEYAANCVAKMEAELSTAKTRQIEAKCIEIFGAIMQNAAIVPALKRSPAGEELFLKLAQFYSEQDVAATALLSESFRNALAIAVYLSAILDGSPAARFVVLDDITSSFDAGNQFALMEAIRTIVGRPHNAQGPQIIILSHDGLLEKYFDRLGGEAGWRHQRLQGASPQGMLFTQGQASDRLKQRALQLLNAGQIQEGQPLVRQYLEFVLQQIIRKVGIPVPIDFAIKDNNKMVSQCLDAISDAVAMHAKLGDLILSPQEHQKLQSVHVPAIVGNWVSHYETGNASGIAPSVLVAVLTAIDGFADCFKYACTCNGSLSRRWFRSLTQKACHC